MLTKGRTFPTNKDIELNRIEYNSFLTRRLRHINYFASSALNATNITGIGVNISERKSGTERTKRRKKRELVFLPPPGGAKRRRYTDFAYDALRGPN